MRTRSQICTKTTSMNYPSNQSTLPETKMASPYAAPKGVQQYGDMEFEWLSMLQTPCYGFSGPYACYSSACTHNDATSHQIPAKQFLNQNRRKYPISNKPPFFKLFQMKNVQPTFAPKRPKDDFEPEITAPTSEWSATEAYPSDASEFDCMSYNTYDQLGLVDNR